MSDESQESKHYVRQYKGNTRHMLQQGKSKLRDKFDEEPLSGSGAAPWDFYGPTEDEEDTERGGDTPNMNVPRERRWLFPKKRHWGALIDDFDKVKQLADPTSRIGQAGAKAIGRGMDRHTMIPSFFADMWLGAEAPEETVAFPAATNTVGVQVGGGSSDTGMNVDKFVEAFGMLLANEVDIEDEEIYVGMTAKQIVNMFGDLKAINQDYVVKKTLETAKIPELLTFKPVHIEGLQIDANGFRRCPVWCKSGMGLGMWGDIYANGAIHPGKKFNFQLYSYVRCGAGRVEDGKVHEIKCKEG